MDMRIANAALAYARAANPVPPDEAASDGKSSFTQFLNAAVGSAAQAVKAGESGALQAALGKGEVTNLVAAVSNAELALETVVAIRDRVINAYQDIIRMPI